MKGHRQACVSEADNQPLTKCRPGGKAAFMRFSLPAIGKFLGRIMLASLLLITLQFAAGAAGAAEAAQNLVPQQLAAYATAQPSRTEGPPFLSASARQERPAGQTFRDCPNCPEMVVVPAGTFRMGSPDREVGRRDNEEPRREISIKSLAVGRFGFPSLG